MQKLNTFKEKGQQEWNRLRDAGKQRPTSLMLWSGTAASAVAGSITLAVAAKGVIAIVSTLAFPPVALTVGAVAGGALGWNYLHGNQNSDASDAEQMDAMPISGATTMAGEGAVAASAVAV